MNSTYFIEHLETVCAKLTQFIEICIFLNDSNSFKFTLDAHFSVDAHQFKLDFSKSNSAFIVTDSLEGQYFTDFIQIELLQKLGHSLEYKYFQNTVTIR